MAQKSKDGYTVLIKQKKLPLSLLADPEKGRTRRVNLLGTSPFAETFSAGRRQKKPKLATDDLAAMAARAAAHNEAYAEGVEAGGSVTIRGGASELSGGGINIAAGFGAKSGGAVMASSGASASGSVT